MTIHISNECDQCGKKAVVQPAPDGRDDASWIKIVVDWTDPSAQFEFDICSLECVGKWCLRQIGG